LPETNFKLSPAPGRQLLQKLVVHDHGARTGLSPTAEGFRDSITLYYAEK